MSVCTCMPPSSPPAVIIKWKHNFMDCLRCFSQVPLSHAAIQSHTWNHMKQFVASFFLKCTLQCGKAEPEIKTANLVINVLNASTTWGIAARHAVGSIYCTQIIKISLHINHNRHWHLNYHQNIRNIINDFGLCSYQNRSSSMRPFVREVWRKE